METEETNLHPSIIYVPEEARITILGVRITLEEHMAEVRYRQGKFPTGINHFEKTHGEGEERMAIVRW